MPGAPGWSAPRVVAGRERGLALALQVLDLSLQRGLDAQRLYFLVVRVELERGVEGAHGGVVLLRGYLLARLAEQLLRRVQAPGEGQQHLEFGALGVDPVHVQRERVLAGHHTGRVVQQRDLRIALPDPTDQSVCGAL